MEITNKQILQIAMAQQAIDFNCQPADFAVGPHKVVISQKNDQARKYLPNPRFFHLASYGSNVVACVDAKMYDFTTGYVQGLEKYYHGFSTPNIYPLEKELATYGYNPFQSEYWLPDMGKLAPLPCPYEMRLLAPENFASLYLPEWGNALSDSRPHLDVLGVGAYHNGQLIGLAGCSADCDTMWQIGIDVLPPYRNQGIAAALTAQLAVEILNRGKVPFYCCNWSNLGSARTAVKAGFRPSWIEIIAVSV